MFVLKTNFTSSKSKRRYQQNDAFLLEDVGRCISGFNLFSLMGIYSLNFTVPVFSCLGLKKWVDPEGNKTAFLRVSYVTVISWFWGDVLFKGAHDMSRKNTEKEHNMFDILLMEQILHQLMW